MQVGDLVFMHNLRTIGIILDEKSVDKETEYQVKWFYTMAPDFTGYRGPGNWYPPRFISSLNTHLRVR